MATELRTEIVESEKARVDLFKWKIILVAALGAVGLGFETGASANSASHESLPHEYLLCLIPFVSVYVDLLCSHLNLRIIVIGRYLHLVREYGPAAEPREPDYEAFVERARTWEEVPPAPRWNWRRLNAFGFENFTQNISSAFFSLLVALWPLMHAVGNAAVFVGAGLSGIACSIIAYYEYLSREDALEKLYLSERTRIRGELAAAAPLPPLGI